MKVRIAVFLTLLSSLIQARPAMAAWGSFVSMGSTIVNSDISCAETTTGHAACAATSKTDAPADHSAQIESCASHPKLLLSMVKGHPRLSVAVPLT